MGFTELILILFIVLIIFGAGKLPQLGEGLGKAIKGFKKSVHEADAIEAEAEAAAHSGVDPGSPGAGCGPAGGATCDARLSVGTDRHHGYGTSAGGGLYRDLRG
jgi:sec-independent protein translocase protein TatA